MIKSPTCAHDKIKIFDTRTVSYRGENRRKRWRKCLDCGQRDTSIEIPTMELDTLYGVDRNSIRVDKLRDLCEETIQALGEVYE